MTGSHREPEPRTPRPAAAFIPPQPSEEDLLELRDPYGPEPPERPDGWPIRAPEYVIVIAASDWYKEHFPATAANLWDALHTSRDRGPEPDLEAEP